MRKILQSPCVSETNSIDTRTVTSQSPSLTRRPFANNVFGHCFESQPFTHHTHFVPLQHINTNCEWAFEANHSLSNQQFVFYIDTMSKHNQRQQSDEQNQKYVPSTRSIYYDSRIANALFPPRYPTNVSDTAIWEDGLREIEAFDWLRIDNEEVYKEGKASPPETDLTPNPGTTVEDTRSDPMLELDHISAETATTPVSEAFKLYKPVPSRTSPPGILEPTPIYEPTNPVQSYSSTPVRPSTPPCQDPLVDPVVQTPQSVHPPRTLEYLQSIRYSPPLDYIREKKVAGDEVLVEMLYNTVVFDPPRFASDPTQNDSNTSQEYFNNMRIHEQGNTPPATPPRPIAPLSPTAPNKKRKYKVIHTVPLVWPTPAPQKNRQYRVIHTAPLASPTPALKRIPMYKNVNVRSKAYLAGLEHRNKRAKAKSDNRHKAPIRTAYASASASAAKEPDRGCGWRVLSREYVVEMRG